MGRMVSIGSIKGYLGRPSGQGPWPAVIVIQEWWGLDNQTETIVDRLAGIGYLAFAPDLFEGELARLGDNEKAAGLTEKYAPEAPQKLELVYDALKEHVDSTGKIGSVGFCFGGRMSLALGLRRPVDALCTFYGGQMQRLFDQLDKLKSPVLALFGDRDESIPQGTVQEFDKLLDRVGVQHEVIVYPDSGHAFFRDRDPSTYKPEAADDAWKRVKGFFKQHLAN